MKALATAGRTPLQNRVNPFGGLFADGSRGTLMGNRGGRFHRDDRTLGTRRFVSRRWICCVLNFKQRQRSVWSNSYTELFFLDEPTALAAGHRPCFECRRAEANAFASLWAQASGQGDAPCADEMDAVLHVERLASGGKPFRRSLDELPDGTFVVRDDASNPLAIHGDRLLPWTAAGYGKAQARPRGVTADVLTPPCIVAVLAAGYRPRWHPSAAL
jgi:hypothetical protein